MDRGAQGATDHGVQRVGHTWATNTLPWKSSKYCGLTWQDNRREPEIGGVVGEAAGRAQEWRDGEVRMLVFTLSLFKNVLL